MNKHDQLKHSIERNKQLKEYNRIWSPFLFSLLFIQRIRRIDVY